MRDPRPRIGIVICLFCFICSCYGARPILAVTTCLCPTLGAWHGPTKRLPCLLYLLLLWRAACPRSERSVGGPARIALKLDFGASRPVCKRKKACCWNIGPKEELANCVLRAACSFQISDLRRVGDFYLRRGWRRHSSKVCRGRTCPLPSDSCLHAHTGPVCNVSRCLKEL